MADPADAAPPGMDAAEYVLGTLDADERRAFLRRLARDPAAVADVAAWRARLAPLDGMVDEVAPPASLWPRIARATDARRTAANDNRGRLWKAAAIAAGLAAVVSTGVALRERPVTTIIQRPILRTTPVAVAALSPAGETPGLFLTYDRRRNALSVIPVGLADDPRRSYQLWLIAGKAPPRSMAVIRAQGATPVDDLRIDPAADLTFAVSIEPRGGSPTGLPTGPVVYSGKLVPFPAEG